MSPFTRVGIPLVAAGGLACACTRPDAAGEAEVGAATTDSAAAADPAGPTTLQVASVMIGRRVGAGNRVTEPTLQFSPSDTVHVSVTTVGSGAGTLTTAWRSQSGAILQKSSEMAHAAGENTVFSLGAPDGLKPGTYKAVVFLDDDSVDTKIFVVKE
jgi:hypothetical protein